MKLPKLITDALYRWVERQARRPPDFIIQRGGEPQLLRWHMLKTRYCGLYLHCFTRDDDDRALHDHPWPSLSIMLKGTVRELYATRDFNPILNEGTAERLHVEGDVIFRKASFAHRILVPGEPAWTLFFVGPRIRAWGFWCAHGWRPWQVFVDQSDSGKIGRGCE